MQGDSKYVRAASHIRNAPGCYDNASVTTTNNLYYASKFTLVQCFRNWWVFNKFITRAMDDQVAILKGSPEMSVLESTRKDFEAMLSVAKKADLSTDEESSRRGIARLVKRTQLNSQLRRIRKNHEQTPLELPEMVRVQSSSRDSYTGTSNATFRYEEEDISSGSKTSASSSRSSSKSGTRKLLQHGRHSGSSVEHHVMVHNESQMGSLKSGQEETSDEEESSSQSNPSPLLPQRSSVSSATSKASKRISDIHSSAPTSQRSLPNQSSRRDSDSSNSERERGTVIRRGCGTAECRSLKVTVHQIDRWILLDQETAGQLIVAVHALNGDTGRYVLQNQLPIAPQFTEAWTWDVRHQSSIAGPAWNQEFAFEFDPGTSLTALLLVFEVMNERNLVAWGFVRPVSRTGVDHTGNKKLQLQLFRVPIRRLLIHPSRPTVSDFFSWIQLARKDKYPATLHATLVPVIGSPASARLDSTGRTTNLISPVSPSRRVRLAGQPFKLPTRKSFTLRPDATVAGALMAKYSPDGSSVAVALTCGDIFVHLTGNSLPTHLKGHQGNVYDLDWMMIDSSQEADQSAWLLSCGADSTARLWGKSNCLVMPHPAFVYCSRFLAKNLIVTGCYDQLIRLWAIHSSSVELVNSYTKHTAPVNCLCWDSSRDLLYSADAVGSICAWNVNDSDLHFDRFFFFSSVW